MEDAHPGSRADAGSAHSAPGVTGGLDAEEARIADQLRARAGTYWGATAATQATAELERADRRSYSRLYWYASTVAGVTRRVVAKVVNLPHHHSSRLTLAGSLDLSEGLRREYEALRLIDGHFLALNDDRIANIRVFDRLEPMGALVMERVTGTPLTDILHAHHRFGRGGSADRLLEIVRNAGVWLREFHSVPVPQANVDRARRTEFVEWIERYAAHLGERVGRPERFATVARTAARAAEATLPEDLPIAVGHGDYARRNILVQGESRVVVLDTLARRHVPIYEDLASFTVGIRFGRLQLQTYGLAFRDDLLVAVDDAFLNGYFGPGQVPSEAFRTYELLVLLDRWAAVTTWGSRGPFGRPARAIANRLLDREVRRAVARLG